MVVSTSSIQPPIYFFNRRKPQHFNTGFSPEIYFVRNQSALVYKLVEQFVINIMLINLDIFC